MLFTIWNEFSIEEKVISISSRESSKTSLAFNPLAIIGIMGAEFFLSLAEKVNEAVTLPTLLDAKETIILAESPYINDSS